MADETRDDIAALYDGDDVMSAPTESLSIGGEDAPAAAAASGDRDAAIDLLLDEIRGLKQQLSSQRSALQSSLTDLQAKLIGTESELNEVSGRASRLEEQLRVTTEALSAANLAKSHLEQQLYVALEDLSAIKLAKSQLEEQLHILQDDLSAAKLAKDGLAEQLRISRNDLSAAKLTVVKQQDELLELGSSIKTTEVMQVKINDLEGMIKLLEEERETSKQKEVDMICKKESELSETIQELRLELAAEKEKKLPLMEPQGLGAAVMVGGVALVTCAAVYLLRQSMHP